MIRLNMDFVNYRVTSGVAFTVLVSIVCQSVFAETAAAPTDDRCEVSNAFELFDRRAFRTCEIELNQCTENRLSQIVESREQARKHCWNRPLVEDRLFVGPCPQTLAELEANVNTDRESVMRLVSIRNHFNLRNQFDADIDVFKRSESLESLREILTIDQHNPIALELLSWTLLFTDDLVEQLNLDLRIQRLDPDCSISRRNFLFFIFRRPNTIVANWLLGQGSGAELTTNEIKDLLLRLQETLIEAYDAEIEESEGALKLYRALDSIHDAILGRKNENFQQIARRIEIGLDDYTENRREELVNTLSREYDVDSHHGRSQSLTLMCSSLALDVGLLDHCIRLLNHFSLLDSKSLESPASDWTRAAISLVIGLTRDCSEHADLLLGWWPIWWDDRPCLSPHHGALVPQISELLRRFLESGASAEREVLEAYLLLDESSDESFLRALSLNESVVVYASRLVKRLHELGKVQAASNILESINPETANRLSSSERKLLENTTNALRDGEYRNWIETTGELLANEFRATENR